MYIAICDDDPTQREYLAQLAEKWSRQNRQPSVIKSYDNAYAFQFAWSEDRQWDVLLLDIQMPGLNGMQLARNIRERDPHLVIVFITGYTDYMDEGYEVEALRYLIKPIKEEKLFACLNRAAEKTTREMKTLLLEQDGETIRIDQEKVVCCEAFAHTIDVTTTEQHYRTRSSIDRLEKATDPELFVRPHRSYLIGLGYISRLAKTELVLDGGKKVPISRRRYAAVNQAFIRFYRGGAAD